MQHQLPLLYGFGVNVLMCYVLRYENLYTIYIILATRTVLFLWLLTAAPLSHIHTIYAAPNREIWKRILWLSWTAVRTYILIICNTRLAQKETLNKQRTFCRESLCSWELSCTEWVSQIQLLLMDIQSTHTFLLLLLSIIAIMIRRLL